MEAKQIENFRTETYQKNTKEGEVINYTTDLIYEKDGTNPHQAVWFNSVADLVNCVIANDFKRLGGSGVWDYNGDNSIFGAEEWERDQSQKWQYGTDYPTKEATVEALTNGEATSKMMGRAAQVKINLYDKHPELFELERSASKMKRRRSYGESGDELNIDRYMSGDPAMWQNMTRRPQKNTMRIMLNSGMNAGADSNKFVENMILIASFVDIIEMAGVNCEVWLAPVANNITQETIVGIVGCKVKSADEPLDLSRFISAGAAGLFRHFTFKTYMNILKGRPSYGLGRSCSTVPAWVKEMFDFDVVINSDDSEDQALTIFTTALKNLQ